ncbi:MAG: hypothetical protein P1U68_07570 [Verrucomicrobiales bacterium]|nr:hypothetical protein [Verrucomicrobiales bacterium]
MKNLFIATFVFLISSSFLQAQQPVQLQVGDVDVKKMEVEAQKTPNFQAGDVKTKSVPNPRDWLEVEVEFSVKGNSDQVVPELLFRYYIGFKDQSGSGRVLTGDIKHINIVPGEETYSAVYVAPSTLGEITGDFRNFREGAVEAVGLEIYYNGVIVGGKSTESGSRAKFWQALGTQPGVLGRDETPFALLWIDRYAESAKK